MSDRLRDLVAHPADRVEGVHGTLEDDADVGPATTPECLRIERAQFLSVEPDRATRDAPVLGQQAGDGEGRGRLATAGLAHETDGLARIDLEADAVHGPCHAALADAELHAQVTHLQEGHVSRLAVRSCQTRVRTGTRC